MKLREWLDFWLNEYQKNNIKLKTYSIYNECINKHINPILGDYDLNDLSLEVLQKFVNAKLNNGNLQSGKGLSISSVYRMLSVLKLSLNLAVSMGKCEKEFASLIKLPKSNGRKIDAFTKEEQKQIEYVCLKKKGNYIGFIICLYTGIRLGELLALTWDDIDFENNMISINKTLGQFYINGKTTTYINSPKTRNSNRIIPFSKQLKTLLQDKKKISSSKYVISSKNGNMVQVRQYQKTFKSLLEACGISHKGIHSLRHTFATRSIEIGMDVKTLSEILGHCNTMITLNRYVHSMMEQKINSINKLDMVLEGYEVETNIKIAKKKTTIKKSKENVSKGKQEEDKKSIFMKKMIEANKKVHRG